MRSTAKDGSNALPQQRKEAHHQHRHSRVPRGKRPHQATVRRHRKDSKGSPRMRGEQREHRCRAGRANIQSFERPHGERLLGADATARRRRHGRKAHSEDCAPERPLHWHGTRRRSAANQGRGRYDRCDGQALANPLPKLFPQSRLRRKRPRCQVIALPAAASGGCLRTGKALRLPWIRHVRATRPTPQGRRNFPEFFCRIFRGQD